jgi:mannose-6-phosphate isomerase-like protein (cupin superfamily)
MEHVKKYSFADSPERRVDASMVIKDLFTEQDAPFDLVIADVDGDHGTHVNKLSDRVYFVLEGSGIVIAGDNKFEVVPLDVVSIPKGTAHSISGKLRVVIITAPPHVSGN